MSDTKKAFITLKTSIKGKDGKTGEKKQKFEEQHALALLKLSNAKWELAEDNYTFDGKELKKKAK